MNNTDLKPIKIETYYTGGGIWITEAELKNNRYAAITNDFVECLTVYEDAPEKFMPENMVFSKAVNELNTTELALYKKMLEDLKKHDDI